MIDKNTLPEDKGTASLFRESIAVGPYQAVLDVWVWEGIQGWSYVFDPLDIQGVDDADLVALVKQAAGDRLLEAESTVQRNPETVFVNLVLEPTPYLPSFDPVDRRSKEQKAAARLSVCEYLKDHNDAEVVKAQQMRGLGDE